MPADLDAAFRKFIPPFGAAGNPVDITGGEPPITYMNTVRLGLEDERIHALILGYWHTIVTPPMVFARNMVQVVEEMKRQGHRQADRRLARRRRRGRGGGAVPLRARHPGLCLLDRDPGRGARREVPVGARRGAALSLSRPVIPIAPEASTRQRKRAAPKGRRVDPEALAQVQALLGAESRQRDLLIEHLHKIQDRFGHLSSAHLAALAQEMRLPQAEVYEVASFYHHFDIVKEGEAAPAPLTVRVCDSLSCEIAGAGDLLARLPKLLGPGVRVVAAPCIGRCEQAPAAVVGQNPIARASCESVVAAVDAGATRDPRRRLHRLRELSQRGRLRAAAGLPRRRARSSSRSSRRSRTRACAASAARASRPGASGASSAPSPAPRLMAVNIDEGEPGTFKDRVLLETDPHRFLEGMLIAAWAVGIDRIYIYLRDEYHGCREILAAEIAALQADPPVSPPARDLPAPRRRGLHLRRRVGDDRIDRRQARPAAPSPAVRRAGRPVRPADARAQLRDAVLGAPAARAGRRLVRLARPPRAQGPALVLGVGAGRATRASSWRRPGSRSRS